MDSLQTTRLNCKTPKQCGVAKDLSEGWRGSLRFPACAQAKLEPPPTATLDSASAMTLDLRETQASGSQVAGSAVCANFRIPAPSLREAGQSDLYRASVRGARSHAGEGSTANQVLHVDT